MIRSAAVCRYLVVLAAATRLGAVTCLADEPARLKLLRPKPHQVVQREGFDPRVAHEHQSGGPALGHGEVPLEIELSLAAALGDAKVQWRAVLYEGAYGRSVDWSDVEGTLEGNRWHANLRLPAGGWYRLEVRLRGGEKSLAETHVEPVGVGELFLVAGQSYAVGANDEIMKVIDPLARVVAFDPRADAWRVAHDPQPNAGDGGTIWPVLGDLLVPFARVPVGFVNAAVGGTSSRQWLPGDKLFADLIAAGKQAGRFRAVLWQQGESDVIEHRSTEAYVKNLVAIREAADRDWGFSPPWLLAKSTLHPTVYKDPEGEARIRAGIDRLCDLPGFRPGPDTDILGREHRGGLGTRRHWSGIGQRRAALLWFAAIWQEMNLK